MYLLLSRITNGLDPLREILEKHIQAAGDAAILENANRAMLVSPSILVPNSFSF